MAWVLKEAFLNFVPAMLELSQGQSLHEKAIQVGVVQNIRSQALALLDASQEAGRDDMEGEADRNSTLMLLTTLLLGVGVAFVVEGRVGDLGSPGATAAAVNVLSLCLGLALAMLAVTLVLVYMNQRRAKALMRTELAKRAVLRDHVFDIGVRQDLEMLRQHNLDLPRPAATVGSLAGGAAPGATGSPADGSPTDRLRRHVEELHSSMANRPAMAGVSMIESVGTLRRDPVYRCVRPAVDKLIFAASMLLLACSALVFGTRMVETTGTATPLAIFGTCLGLGGSLAVYFGASEMCWCTHRDALSVCALWRCWVNGAPVLAYHVLGYPSVWRNRLRATMEDADDEKRQDWLSAPKAARHLSAVYGGAEMRGKWRRFLHTRNASLDVLQRHGQQQMPGDSPRRRRAGASPADAGAGAAAPGGWAAGTRGAAAAATPATAGRPPRPASRPAPGSGSGTPYSPAYRASSPVVTGEPLGETFSDELSYFAGVAAAAESPAAHGAAVPARSPWSYKANAGVGDSAV